MDLKSVEKEYILKIFELYSYSPVKTAKVLNISRATLYRKLKSYGVDFSNKYNVIKSCKDLIETSKS